MLVPLTVFLCLFSQAQIDRSQENTSSLLETLHQNPLDLSALAVLVKRTGDPRVTQALKDAFAEAKLSDARIKMDIERPLSQLVAAWLLERGVHDDIYFEELALHARATISANPPDVFIESETGKPASPDDVTPAFRQWCAKRGLEFPECWRFYASLATDLVMLTAGHDSRAVSILREALQLTNSGLVDFAVGALANMNDIDSIPLIASACSRFSPKDAETCALFASSWPDARADAIIDRFVRDPEVRARVKRDRLEKTAPKP